MFNSGVLDVVIGLVFIYLLYSLLATIIQELIASWFSFRAKILERAIVRMLEDESRFDHRIKSIFYLFRRSGNGGDPDTVSYEFYKHPLMKFLGENKRSNKPSYINKETFSKVMIDLLRGNDVKPGDDIRPLIQKALDSNKLNWGGVKISNETLSYLKSVWVDAQGEVEKFRESLESWFDATMERATGWYKKNTQIVLLVIGMILAITFNVDTIKITGKLSKDPKLREQLVMQADAFVKAHPQLDQELLAKQAEYEKFLSRNTLETINSNDSLKVKKSKDSLNVIKSIALQAKRDSLIQTADSLVKTDLKKANDLLGLGWKSYNFKQCESKKSICKAWCIIWTVFLSLIGWLITALAISMGAPFWFDLLNKVMKLRNSVGSLTTGSKTKDKESKQ